MKRPAPIKPRNILAVQLWQCGQFRLRVGKSGKRSQQNRKTSKHQLHRDARA